MLISKLHCLTWDNAPISHIEQVKKLLNAGADWIQLRQKKGTELEKLQIASEAAILCKKYKATLIINDSPDICLKSEADGVHLGLSDSSVFKARELLGEKAIIGGTANSQHQVLQRVAEKCDYIGIGPWSTTNTKENLSKILGETGVKSIVALNINIPVIVIGGIVPSDVKKIMHLGVHGIAVSSNIVATKNIKEAFLTFSKYIAN